MKYPYIGKDSHNQIYLMLSSSDALTMDSAAFTHTPIEEVGYKNITHEYLQNTCGEVVSPEHAEFIIELAELHGFKRAFTTPSKTINAFAFKGDNLYLYGLGLDKLNQLPTRKITIPLPPKFNKASEILNPNNADVKLGNPEPLKNAGDNLILGCEQNFKKARAVASDLRKDMGCSDELLAKGDDWKVIEEDIKYLDWISRAWTPIESESDEWPQAGDEVCYKNSENVKGVVLAIDDIVVWVKDKRGGYSILNIENISKPKTPEEELRDEIVKLIKGSEGFGAQALASTLIAKYNIKPQ